jgi:hypothetical protein
LLFGDRPSPRDLSLAIKQSQPAIHTTMSTTEDEESDYTDEDLAAPPRKKHSKSAIPPPQANNPVVRSVQEDDITADEEDVVELSPQQYRHAVATATATAAVTAAATAATTRKRSTQVPASTSPTPVRDKYSAIVRRDTSNRTSTHKIVLTF